MRILHISSATTFGGGERHLVDLCRELVERGPRQAHAPAPDGALDTHAGKDAHVLGGGCQGLVAGVAQGPREGMIARALERQREVERRVAREPAGDLHVREARDALGQRAGLVEEHLADARLVGGIEILRDQMFFELSELVGNGTQEVPPLSDRFKDTWTGRGVALQLRQDGTTVSGCYDGTGDLAGTVSGNILRATGVARPIAPNSDETGRSLNRRVEVKCR